MSPQRFCGPTSVGPRIMRKNEMMRLVRIAGDVGGVECGGESLLKTKKAELPEYGFRWWDIGGGYEQIKGDRAGELRKV